METIKKGVSDEVRRPIKNSKIINTPAISKVASPKAGLNTKEGNLESVSSTSTEANIEKNTNEKSNQSPNLSSTSSKTVKNDQSTDFQRISKTTELCQKRPKTVLQCLLSRPLSSADAIVKMKSDQIRLKQMQKQKKIEEEQTAVARKRKEEYERKSKCPPPLPDALLELEKKSNMQNTEKKKTAKRASTRMFIKRPIIQELDEVPYELEFAVKLNPKLPNMFNKRLTYAAVYPTE